MQVALRSYEGLVLATARLVVALSEEDIEDVEQLLRIKAWQALRAYDPAKSRTSRDKYVFMCVRDRAKDVMKKKHRGELHIEDLRAPDERGNHTMRSDSFDARYLCSTRDENYAVVEDDALPIAGLDGLEQAIVSLLLTGDFIHAELADRLDVSRAEIRRALKSIRCKLRDEPDPAPVVALPVERRKVPPIRDRGHFSDGTTSRYGQSIAA